MHPGHPARLLREAAMRHLCSVALCCGLRANRIQSTTTFTLYTLLRDHIVRLFKISESRGTIDTFTLIHFRLSFIRSSFNISLKIL